MADEDVFLYPGDATDTTVILHIAGLVVTQINVSDSLQVTVTESSENFITLHRSDQPIITVVDSSENALTATASDTLAVVLSDTATLVISVYVVASDQLALAISEAAAIAVSLERPEFCVLSLSEASDHYLTTLVTDNLSVALVDAAVQEEAVINIAGTDQLTVVLLDEAIPRLFVVTSDELRAAIEEGGVLIQETTVYVPVLEVAADTRVSEVEAHTSTTAVDAELVDRFVYVEYESATASASKVKVEY